MTEGTILRTDTKGRVVVTPERRAALLAEFDRSGISGAQFAKWAGVKYPTFAFWVQQRRREKKAAEGSGEMKSRGEPGPEVRWLEAVVKSEGKAVSEETKAPTGLVVHGPGGVWIEITQEEQVRWAALLLRHLGDYPRC